jgi:hypothetical protein
MQYSYMIWRNSLVSKHDRHTLCSQVLKQSQPDYTTQTICTATAQDYSLQTLAHYIELLFYWNNNTYHDS